VTAKDKAKELIETFTFNCRECDNAKLSALFVIDEILIDDWYIATREDLIARKKYCEEVRQEIYKF
jgi:hypothetical protein